MIGTVDHDDDMAHSLDSIDWPVHTDRLVIRRAARSDVDAIWAIRSAPGVTDWLSTGAGERSSFEHWFCATGRISRVLVVELAGVEIGDVRIKIEDGRAQEEVAVDAQGVEAELGWVFDPVHSGRGYASETVRELFRLCFDELGLRRVVAHCFADNDASWKLMERVGMRREAHTKADFLHRSGVWLDGLSFALLAEEWRSGRT
jgi:RimJ/RimL family protein N-acetyltransferase